MMFFNQIITTWLLILAPSCRLLVNSAAVDNKAALEALNAALDHSSNSLDNLDRLLRDVTATTTTSLSTEMTTSSVTDNSSTSDHVQVTTNTSDPNNTTTTTVISTLPTTELEATTSEELVTTPATEITSTSSEMTFSSSGDTSLTIGETSSTINETYSTIKATSTTTHEKTITSSDSGTNYRDEPQLVNPSLQLNLTHQENIKILSAQQQILSEKGLSKLLENIFRFPSNDIITKGQKTKKHESEKSVQNINIMLMDENSTQVIGITNTMKPFTTNVFTGPWYQNVESEMEELMAIVLEVEAGFKDQWHADQIDQHSTNIDILVTAGNNNPEIVLATPDIEFDIMFDLLTNVTTSVDITLQTVREDLDIAKKEEKSMLVTVVMMSILFVCVLVAFLVLLIKPWSSKDSNTAKPFTRTAYKPNEEFKPKLRKLGSYNNHSYLDDSQIVATDI